MLKYVIQFGLNKKKIKYISTKDAVRNGLSPSPRHQITRVFYYLREHMELTEDREYKRLYKEALDYLVHYAVVECGYNPLKKRQARKNIEILADIYNSLPDNQTSKYTKEQVDEFLEYRRLVWH